MSRKGLEPAPNNYYMWEIGMDYLGYNIRVATFSEPSGVRFTNGSSYTITRGTQTLASGTLATNFRTMGDAERAAYSQARLWIDRGRRDIATDDVNGT